MIGGGEGGGGARGRHRTRVKEGSQVKKGEEDLATRASVGHLVAKPNDLSFKSYNLYLTKRLILVRVTQGSDVHLDPVPREPYGQLIIK